MGESVIKSVNAKSITVANPAKKNSEKTYAIITGMGGTEVTIDGVRSAVTDLKPGMAVSVSENLSSATAIVARVTHSKKDK